MGKIQKQLVFLIHQFFISLLLGGKFGGHGIEGIYVKIEDTVRSFKSILDGEADDLPEAAFLYVGTIEEARKKAESLK